MHRSRQLVVARSDKQVVMVPHEEIGVHLDPEPVLEVGEEP